MEGVALLSVVLFFLGTLWGLQGEIVFGAEAVLAALCGWPVFLLGTVPARGLSQVLAFRGKCITPIDLIKRCLPPEPYMSLTPVKVEGNRSHGRW